MKCPVDGATLVMSERHGVEIDYCPTCRGVWLDRGELDKILDAATGPLLVPDPAPAPEAAAGSSAEEQVNQSPGTEDRGPVRRQEKPRKRKRKSPFAEFLEEVFDFD